jgi:hypothetical protein
MLAHSALGTSPANFSPQFADAFLPPVYDGTPAASFNLAPGTYNGFLQGSVLTLAVPEPTTWTLMIAGAALPASREASAAIGGSVISALDPVFTALAGPSLEVPGDNVEVGERPTRLAMRLYTTPQPAYFAASASAAIASACSAATVA